MNLGLSGKTALVTGASVGLGRAIAAMLAAEGCRVAILARRRSLLATLAAELTARGHAEPLVLEQDLLADGMASAVRDRVLAAFGGLDILVNNAGGSRPLEGLGTVNDWNAAMQLNFGVARELGHALVPSMRERRYGRIVNLTGGEEPVALNAGVPPNGATHIWAKSLSRVVGRDGITVNCIAPGRIHSEQIDERLLPTAEAQRKWVEENCPVGYIGDPDDVAAIVTFLVSPLARYITGQVIYVDGGARRSSH